MTRLYKPIVVFLDDEEAAVREAFLKRFDIPLCNVDVHKRYMCISNISRYGNRLSQWSVRTSDTNPHFINRDCYKNALVYGESDWIGAGDIIHTSEYTFIVPPLQYEDLLQCDYVNGMIKIADNIVLGDIECQ